MKFFMIRLNGRLSKVSTAALRDEATGGIYFLKNLHTSKNEAPVWAIHFEKLLSSWPRA